MEVNVGYVGGLEEEGLHLKAIHSAEVVGVDNFQRVLVFKTRNHLCEVYVDVLQHVVVYYVPAAVQVRSPVFVAIIRQFY